MASGKLNKITLFGKFAGNKTPVEMSFKKTYQAGVWRTNTDVSRKKWESKASKISNFIENMNIERKLKGYPKSKGAFIYELRGFASNKGCVIPSKFYQDKLHGKTPYICMIRGFRGDGFSLLVTSAKLPQEFAIIGTGNYYDASEERYIEQCMVPLVLVKNTNGEFESINQF